MIPKLKLPRVSLVSQRLDNSSDERKFALEVSDLPKSFKFYDLKCKNGMHVGRAVSNVTDGLLAEVEVYLSSALSGALSGVVERKRSLLKILLVHYHSLTRLSMLLRWTPFCGALDATSFGLRVVEHELRLIISTADSLFGAIESLRYAREPCVMLKLCQLEDYICMDLFPRSINDGNYSEKHLTLAHQQSYDDKSDRLQNSDNQTQCVPQNKSSTQCIEIVQTRLERLVSSRSDALKIEGLSFFRSFQFDDINFELLLCNPQYIVLLHHDVGGWRLKNINLSDTESNISAGFHLTKAFLSKQDQSLDLSAINSACTRLLSESWKRRYIKSLWVIPGIEVFNSNQNSIFSIRYSVSSKLIIDAKILSVDGEIEFKTKKVRYEVKGLEAFYHTVMDLIEEERWMILQAVKLPIIYGVQVTLIQQNICYLGLCMPVVFSGLHLSLDGHLISLMENFEQKTLGHLNSMCIDYILSVTSKCLRDLDISIPIFRKSSGINSKPVNSMVLPIENFIGCFILIEFQENSIFKLHLRKVSRLSEQISNQLFGYIDCKNETFHNIDSFKDNMNPNKSESQNLSDGDREFDENQMLNRITKIDANHTILLYQITMSCLEHTLEENGLSYHRFVDTGLRIINWPVVYPLTSVNISFSDDHGLEKQTSLTVSLEYDDDRQTVQHRINLPTDCLTKSIEEAVGKQEN